MSLKVQLSVLELAIANGICLAFEPGNKLTCEQWIEKHIRLSSKQTKLGGRYSFKFTPYLRGICRAIDNNNIRKVVILKSAQTGLTTLATAILLFYICTKNVPLAYFTATTSMARQYSEKNFSLALELCEEAKRYRGSHVDDEKILQFDFKRGFLKIAGAGSVNELASSAIGFAIMDEIAKWIDDPLEAPSLNLALERLSSYGHDSKAFIFSTPIEEDVCPITREYNTGTQSKYMVPSPYSDRFFELTLDSLKLPEKYKDAGKYDWNRIEDDTYVECPFTKKPIYQDKKDWMADNGVWTPTNPNADRTVESFHVSSLYSRKVSWGEITKLNIQSKDNLGAKKNLFTNKLGIPWKQFQTNLKRQDVTDLINQSPKFNKGELIARPVTIIMGCDTQRAEGGHFWYVTVAVTEDGGKYLIDWGMAASVEDLDLISQKRYTFNGEEFQVYKAIIDAAGGRTQEIYKLALDTNYRFIPCFGRTKEQGLLAPSREMTIPTGYGGHTPITYMQINDPHFKSQVFIDCIKRKVGKLYLPQDGINDENLLTHFSSAKLVQTKAGMEWQESEKNHMADCLKYALGLIDRIRPYIEVWIQERKDTETATAQNDQASSLVQSQEPDDEPMISSYIPTW